MSFAAQGALSSLPRNQDIDCLCMNIIYLENHVLFSTFSAAAAIDVVVDEPIE